ncbi:killer cell lectin-like receptor subfamily B member 1 [Callospermophilus lateralis]|uniref:killer cell lectin-like receptor subfamily B member 1 n=1 Tax=Callospermophilus lateralis TaxID=76772 RepID=UPI00405400FC
MKSSLGIGRRFKEQQSPLHGKEQNYGTVEPNCGTKGPSLEGSWSQSATDRQVVYADLSLSRGQAPESSLPLSDPQDVSQGLPWHRLAWKLGCAGKILFLSVIGLRVLEILCQLQCPKHWLQLQDKCLTFSGSSKTWNDSLADCSQGEFSLLLIQDQEELKIPNSERGFSFFPRITNFCENKGNSCASISKMKVFSEICNSENKWICEKKLKPFRNIVSWL